MRRPTIWKSATTRITGCHVQYHAQCTGNTLRTDAGGQDHLCLEADQRTSGLLDALDRANGWATFYCTPDFWSPTANCCGGWLPPVMRWAYWRRAARTRRSSCGGAMKPCTGPLWERPGWLCAGRGDDGAASLGEGRLAVPDALDGPGGYKLESSSNASALMKRVSARRGDVSVWLGTTASAAGLREFVISAQGAGHYCRAMTEIG